MIFILIHFLSLSFNWRIYKNRPSSTNLLIGFQKDRYCIKAPFSFIFLMNIPRLDFIDHRQLIRRKKFIFLLLYSKHRSHTILIGRKVLEMALSIYLIWILLKHWDSFVGKFLKCIRRGLIINSRPSWRGFFFKKSRWLVHEWEIMLSLIKCMILLLSWRRLFFWYLYKPFLWD